MTGRRSRAPVAENYEPIEPAFGPFGPDGAFENIRPGEVFAADHPLVRDRPELFKPVQPTRRRPVVEQATAAPGEVRGAA